MQEGTLIVNTEQMEAENLDMPKSIKDLANPEYKGKIAVTDITSSSTAWLLIQGLISEYGEEEAKEILTDIYANAGEGESSQDLVFGGQNIIAENGTCLVQSDRFKNACICADLDLGRIISERRRMTTFRDEENRSASYETVYFELNTEDSAKKDSKKAGH